MKGSVIAAIVTLLIVSGCAEQFARNTPEKTAPSPSWEEQKAVMTTVDEAEMQNKEEGTLRKQEQAQPQLKESKQSETGCTKTWQQLVDHPNPLLGLEPEMISLFFREGVSFEEAKKVLNNYKAQVVQVTELFPLGQERSDEEKYRTYRRIKAQVERGSEIATACKILQDQKVEDATPAIKVTLNNVVQQKGRET